MFFFLMASLPPSLPSFLPSYPILQMPAFWINWFQRVFLLRNLKGHSWIHFSQILYITLANITKKNWFFCNPAKIVEWPALTAYCGLKSAVGSELWRHRFRKLCPGRDLVTVFSVTWNQKRVKTIKRKDEPWECVISKTYHCSLWALSQFSPLSPVPNLRDFLLWLIVMLIT